MGDGTTVFARHYGATIFVQQIAGTVGRNEKWGPAKLYVRLRKNPHGKVFSAFFNSPWQRKLISVFTFALDAKVKILVLFFCQKVRRPWPPAPVRSQDFRQEDAKLSGGPRSTPPETEKSPDLSLYFWQGSICTKQNTLKKWKINTSRGLNFQGR